MESFFELPTTLADVNRIERRLGWSYSYGHGRADMIPAGIQMDAFLSIDSLVDARPLGPFRTRSVEGNDAYSLEDLVVEAYRSTTEADGMKKKELRKEVRFSLFLYASGGCGEPMPCSRAVFDGSEPIAAILVVAGDKGPKISELVVDPFFQRQGIATALLYQVMAYLKIQGFDGLHSRFDLSNIPSRRWHHKMGFTERPDYSAAKHCLEFYQFEVARLRAKLEELPAEIETAERELERWERLAAKPVQGVK